MTKYGSYVSKRGLSVLRGKTLTSISGLQEGSDSVIFFCDDGTDYTMDHRQDCCETVSINDVVGDVKDLIGTPITMADAVSNADGPALDDDDKYGSFTWTFYKLATVKGYVDIRWYGSSNGYYSEDVDFWQSGGPLSGESHDA